MTSLRESNLFLKCRICVSDIQQYSNAITIFCKDFLDEKIRKYLHVNIDFSDKFHKRICRKCLIKLEDIHQFACLAQKNQQIFIKYAEELKTTVSNSVKLTKTPLVSNEDITIFAYDELKLGQVIKDHDLLKLILKALKWSHSKRNQNTQIEKLKNTNFHEVLANPDLLRDTDLMQLLGPYVKQDRNGNGGPKATLHRSGQEKNVEVLELGQSDYKSNHSNNDGTADETSVEMEVVVDPDLFFPYDDDETRSAEETIELEELKPLKCPTCPELYKTELELKEHILRHMMEKHEQDELDAEKEADEEKINEMLDELVPRKRTRRKPTSSRFTCPTCKKKLSTKGNLKVHLETHKPKGKFSCDKCGRIFKTYINLVRHRKYHSGDKFSCPTCSRVYPTKSTLRAHIITHSNVRPHDCPICHKTFKRNQDLKFHINQHTGMKPYKCDKCDKAFASSGNCFSHRKRMHSDKV
ncbi:zinc finger protein 1 homolog [Bradysia coprophila]|uniref:zinc finger protein 1 homolog n=1 Tax=Bradysia coprophila TaxID=38358 RepID=UPI00187D82BF|nr:zinc finger protein 1 homolog [Bradysia coprophila]